MQVIRFHRANEAYGCFSNFALYPVELKGKEWPTAEHYFQAQKFAGTDWKEAIRLAESPVLAARMGARQRALRADREEVKDGVMQEAVLAKFAQNRELRQTLIDTGDALLVEHTRNDSYWGDGCDGLGKNRLGQILMEVRALLAADSPPLDRSRAG